MHYQTIYNSLIQKRLDNPATGYTETHHIKPKSMGGTDDPSNLVVLTAREHWIAHLLLWKIHRNRQTACACHMMAMGCNERGIPKIKNSNMYQHVSSARAAAISKALTGVPLSKERKQKISNALKGNKVVISEEQKKKISNTLKGHATSDATRQKISNKLKSLKWIYNESTQSCKRIPYENDIPEGWKLGRKIKW